uniref:Uncharacterized protein n=1 Tax=Setaria italica TaxID=4555 RepID=K3YFA6_SETIT
MSLFFPEMTVSFPSFSSTVPTILGLLYIEWKIERPSIAWPSTAQHAHARS